jgi:hypothetical protein
MIIYDKNERELLTVNVDDESFRHRSIRSDNAVTLYYSLTEHVELPVGSYINFQGERYTLWLPENFTKEGTREYAYTVVFGGTWEFLKLVKYKNLSMMPKELKFTLWADPAMFLRLLIDNLNEADPAQDWRMGDCLESVRKNLSFSHEYCYDVLQRLADEFKTEFEFESKTLHFRKVEKWKDEPLALSYGKGNGFLPGTGRTGKGKAPATRLYVQGGDRNIDYSKYGSRTLLLPKGQTLAYNGRLYKTDPNGTHVERADKTPDTYVEDSYDASEIYPSRVGEVTEAIIIDPEKHLYQFKDSTIPAELNFEDCIVEGETMTVIFQSGGLIGREFEVKYRHQERLFEIIPATLDGFELPGESLKPEKADTYAVFNIALPEAYVCNNTDQTGASWEMFRQAARYFYDNEDEQFSFTGDLDGLWSKKKWYEIGSRITPGGYVLFSDEQYQKEGVLIRITGVKDYINDPHSPQIELSNVAVSGSLSSNLGKLEAEEVVNKGRHKDVLSLTRRRWRDTVEMGKMLELAIDGFSAAINPVTVSTMQLRVGSEQLQYRFVDNKTDLREIIPKFVVNNDNKTFSAPACILQHLTLGIDTISVSHTSNEYKCWDMASFPALYVGDDAGAFYLYAKCSKTTADGNFLLSKTPAGMDPDDGFYYFLVGTLGSQWEGERSFEICYGFTEILPGRITVNLIKSPDGYTYFNLAEGEIGGNIRIKTGSGYNNLTDKPNLGIYATYVDFGVLSDRIYANATSINNLWQKSAGWVTWSEGNLIYATQTDLQNGQKLISYINQTAGSTTIYSSRINLTGAVHFNALDTDMKNRLNSKANASDLGAMAYENAVQYARLGTTIVVGGYLNTDLIKVRRIDATTGFIGGFKLSNNNLLWEEGDYFGGPSRRVRLGVVNSYREGTIDVMFNAATDGSYGIKVVGAAPGGAAIYASSGRTGTHPSYNSTYAGYFDGGVHVQGTLYSELCLAKRFGCVSSVSGGTYTYNEGISFDSNHDLDDRRFTVRGGLIVALHRDNGSIIIG